MESRKQIESVCEKAFVEDFYGFRPICRCHDALKALRFGQVTEGSFLQPLFGKRVLQEILQAFSWRLVTVK